MGQHWVGVEPPPGVARPPRAKRGDSQVAHHPPLRRDKCLDGMLRRGSLYTTKQIQQIWIADMFSFAGLLCVAHLPRWLAASAMTAAAHPASVECANS